MKTSIHPKYNESAEVSCSCGSRFTVGSTKEEIKIEICSQCHPFYTGEMKFVDTRRKVEKFREKRAKAAETAAITKKSQKQIKEREEKIPKTLKEMLMEIKKQAS